MRKIVTKLLKEKSTIFNNYLIFLDICNTFRNISMMNYHVKLQTSEFIQ